MTTWIIQTDAPGDGPRLAVKDAMDVAGLPTTVGCAAIAERARPAAVDASVVASARAQGARIAGKAKLSGRIHRRIQHMKDVAEAGMLDWAIGVQKALRAELGALLRRHPAIALPVLTRVAPEPGEADESDLLLTTLTGQINAAGFPAFALPVPLPGSHLPASVQLIGPPGGEEELCGLAAALEAALA